MAGIVDMTHTAVKNKQKLRGNLKHLYLAFPEQVLNVFSLIVSVLKKLGQCGIPTPILGDIREWGWGIRPG